MTEPEIPPAAAGEAPTPAPDGPAVTDPAAVGPEAELKAQLERVEATAADNWNRYLRAAAELDNARRRAARDVEQARRAGLERLATELVGVIDGIEMGLAHSEGATAASLLEGQQATLRLLQGVFEKVGIETLDPAGQAFDPQLHEAMSMIPAPGAKPGSVLVVMQKGYRLQERLLRPARVVVAGDAPSGPEAGTADA